MEFSIPLQPPNPPQTTATTTTTTQEKPLSTYTHLLQTLSSFLTISIHSILYTRTLYPPTSFLQTRAWNYPVWQNRHPLVCKWINDAVVAVIEQVSRGVVDKVIVVIFHPSSSSEKEGGGGGGGKGEVQILERYIFDLSRFVVMGSKEDFHTELERGGHVGVGMVDVEEALRGAVGRLAMVGGKLGVLPTGCSFSVVVELKHELSEVAPIGHPQPWIPSQPSLQPKTGRGEDSKGRGGDLGGFRCIPVRAVEVGEFVMEMWVEEGKGKGVGGR